MGTKHPCFLLLAIAVCLQQSIVSTGAILAPPVSCAASPQGVWEQQICQSALFLSNPIFFFFLSRLVHRARFLWQNERCGEHTHRTLAFINQKVLGCEQSNACAWTFHLEIKSKNVAGWDYDLLSELEDMLVRGSNTQMEHHFALAKGDPNTLSFPLQNSKPQHDFK
jgi:hypothetical protein